ncbi:CgeB family protein [Metabacillus litoralis]|uniref:CgeB family protein n=1 Tax=Metabacillus litoralis TaxID=152268 RepID=UPI00203ADE38|nr:glycosyltransferase [Metabacillus litoralis]MCM3409925.1 glycosyltransferase [Metabacillus litoralis]
MDSIKLLALVANWNGSNDLSFARGFTELGCEVHVIDSKVIQKEITITERFYKKVSNTFFKSSIENYNNYIKETFDSICPNMVFISKGLWITNETIKYFQSKDSLVIHWHPDDAFNKDNTSEILNANFPLFDLIITPKSFNVAEYKQNKAKEVLYLPYAYDPLVHSRVEHEYDNTNTIYHSDLAFVGTKRKKRVKQLEKIKRQNLDLKIWGGGWNKLLFSNLKSSCMYREVHGEEMSKVFSSSKIILGFLNAENRDLHTARTYEIPACGGFFLGERTNEHQEILQEGKEADFFNSDEELIEKINFYLKRNDLREKISKNGYEKITSNQNTYRDRAISVMKHPVVIDRFKKKFGVFFTK